jgi:hypothetical protein
VRGLPPDQACEALTVSKDLTDAEVFLLMACLRVGKSPSERVFRRSAIERRPSIALPLEAIRISPKEVTKSLLSKGLLLSAGLGRVSTSASGEIVKHRYSILRNDLRLRGVLPPMGSRPSDIPILRDYMRRLCDGVPF